MDIVMMMMMMSRFVEHVINGPQMRCRSAEQVCLQMSSECQWGVLQAGKLFQMNGPATAKLVIPIVCNLQIIRREIGEIMRYSCDQKKTKFLLPLKLSLLRGSRPKSAVASPQHLSHNVPNFTKIGSLSEEL